MRRSPESFSGAVRAFRDLTAATDDAAATRARVLAAADRGSRARATPRRIALATVVALLVICTASLAGTTLAQRWRRPAEVAIDEPQTIPALASTTGRRASVVIPPAPPADVDGDAALPSGPSDAEAAAYGRAHRAHFEGGPPERALAAWDDYLRRYPRGAFGPEARYNRALCLARLRRLEEAERALLPFADGQLGGYRRAEANQMLDWLHERRPAP
jgi:TolA-binding protein